MKLQDSEAWGCRWFDVLLDPSVEKSHEGLTGLGDLEVLADFSYNDYQGEVAVAFLSHNQDRVYYIEYYYGSCGGCDAWEDQGDEAARNEILLTMVDLSPAEFIKFASEHKKLQCSVEQMVLRLFN